MAKKKGALTPAGATQDGHGVIPAILQFFGVQASFSCMPLVRIWGPKRGESALRRRILGHTGPQESDSAPLDTCSNLPTERANSRGGAELSSRLDQLHSVALILK